MRKIYPRLSILLAIVLIFCSLSVPTFAEDNTTAEEFFAEEPSPSTQVANPDPKNESVLSDDPDPILRTPQWYTSLSGQYKIKMEAANYYVELPAGNIAENTILIQWVSANNRNSRYKFCYLGEGLYCIRSMAVSCMGLKAVNGMLVNATIGTSNSISDISIDALWRVFQDDHGLYISNHGTGKVITSPSSTNYGYNYQLYLSTFTGSSLQYWTFPSISGTTGGIDFRSSTTTLVAGESFQFTATQYSSIIDQNGQQGITWSVTNGTGNATISSTGVLTGHLPGTVTVTATCGSYSNSKTVTITLPITEGAYLINSRIAPNFYVTIDDNDSANNRESQNAILELHNYDNQPYQMWDFIHVWDGYYKIMSLQSGKVISVQAAYVNTNEKALVQQTYTGADTQLWKLELNASGYYIIRPKSGEQYPTDWCMRIGYYLFPYYVGRDIEQRPYTNDSDYGDEWDLVPLNSNILSNVPTSLVSNSSHLCIPCAITNTAGYWCIIGFTQFNCATASTQETAACQVQAIMQTAGVDGHKSNSNIPLGFSIFNHIDGNTTYTLAATNCWGNQNAFDWGSIVQEINAGRPCLLGFATGNPYNNGAHMTVCVGYEIINEVKYVYVSDAYSTSYELRAFSTNYNDFISKVSLTSN